MMEGEMTPCLFSLDLNNVLLAASWPHVILGAKTNKLICADVPPPEPDDSRLHTAHRVLPRIYSDV